MAARLRVFLIGVDAGDLEPLRRRSTADEQLEVVGSALVTDWRRAGRRLPEAVDAVLMTPAALRGADGTAPAPPPRAGDEDDEVRRGLIEELTHRERDVLALVADGRGNRDIALQLGISEHTVKFHLASIFGKLGVSSRTQAVRRALELGVIDI